MTLMHCLVCDELRVLGDGAGEARCVCGSSAELTNGSVIVRGPCRVVWVDKTQVVTTVVGSARWPGVAPDVVRMPVPPPI